MIRFWWPWSNFQGHLGHITMKTLCFIFWSNGQILTKLAPIHHRNNFKNWFGDLDLIFNMDHNACHLSAFFLPTLWPGVDQTGTDTPFGWGGGGGGDLDLIFNQDHIIKKKPCLNCTFWPIGQILTYPTENLHWNFSEKYNIKYRKYNFNKI